jgi:flagellar biosynthesis regulator FlbT
MKTGLIGMIYFVVQKILFEPGMRNTKYDFFVATTATQTLMATTGSSFELRFYHAV